MIVDSQKKFSRVDILGIQFSALDLASAVGLVSTMIENGQRGYVCVCPVSTIMACQEDKKFLDIVNSADLVTLDGMPSVWIARAKGLKNVGRVYGPDLMLAICELSQPRGYKHYFYGSTRETLDKLIDHLKLKFPKLKISGSFSPPFRKATVTEDEEVVERINRANPDFLWVGLGSPKQDFWIYEHRDRINASVMLAVGAAFDFIAGTKPQAPKWMQRSGLEWLFRLCCEPKRLWRRYLIGNTMFIFLLMKEFIRSGFRK